MLKTPYLQQDSESAHMGWPKELHLTNITGDSNACGPRTVNKHQEAVELCVKNMGSEIRLPGLKSCFNHSSAVQWKLSVP